MNRKTCKTKLIAALLLAVVLSVCSVLCGCSPQFDKSPAEYEGIRWISYDYSFCFDPADDCKGYYRFDETVYNIKVDFDSSRLTVFDVDNANTELFTGDWTYETSPSGSENLFVHSIVFNKKDYEAFRTNYAEFVSLKQEKV